MLQKIRSFLSSPQYYYAFGLWILLWDLLSADSAAKYGVNLMLGAIGVMVSVGVIGVVLFLTDDLSPALFSVLAITLLAARLYNSFVMFTQTIAWVTFPMGSVCAVGFLYFLFKNRKPISIGKSFWGIVAVTVAVTLGGLGKLPWSHYFSAIYYVIFLGVGMLFIYLVLRSQFAAQAKNGVDIRRRFALMFTVLGGLTVLMSLRSFVWDLPQILQDMAVPDWKFRNNYSSMLMIAFPAPLYFAKKHRAFVLLSAGMYLSMLILGSRGGLMLGTVEFFLCLVFLTVADKKYRWVYGSIVLVCIAAGVLASGLVLQYFSSRTGGGLISSGEQRARLLLRSFEDFKHAPNFGQGLGYRGNYDIYHPKMGAMAWYHMMLPQIYAGLGCVGILAYGYQAVQRFWMTAKSKSWENWVLYLCFFGLFLMAQVNPGEFVPIPYEVIAVSVFILFEIAEENREHATKQE